MNTCIDCPPVIIGVGPGTGLAVARSLGGKGVTVYAMDLGKFSPARYSKFTKKPPWGYTTSVDEQLLSNLIKFAKSMDKKPVLIPTTDSLIEFLWKNHNELSKYFDYWEIYSHEMSIKLLNKKDFYKICDKFGIDYPKVIFMDEESDVNRIYRKLRFPIIIKPYFIHKWKKLLRGQKVILAKDANEFHKFLSTPKFERLLLESMVQEVIPGPESNIYVVKVYLSKSGEIKEFFSGRKLRQYPPNFGSGSLVESYFNKEVVDKSIEFFTKLGINGLGGTEFKYDHRDKKYKMIEVNMRPQLWDDIMRVTGKDLIWYGYCDLVGLNCKSMQKQIYGYKWVYLTRDVISALWFIKHGEMSIKDWLNSYKDVKTFAVLDLKDPGTILGTVLYTFYQFFEYFV